MPSGRSARVSVTICGEKKGDGRGEIAHYSLLPAGVMDRVGDDWFALPWFVLKEEKQRISGRPGMWPDQEFAECQRLARGVRLHNSPLRAIGAHRETALRPIR